MSSRVHYAGAGGAGAGSPVFDGEDPAAVHEKLRAAAVEEETEREHRGLDLKSLPVCPPWTHLRQVEWAVVIREANIVPGLSAEVVGGRVVVYWLTSMHKGSAEAFYNTAKTLESSCLFPIDVVMQVPLVAHHEHRFSPQEMDKFVAHNMKFENVLTALRSLRPEFETCDRVRFITGDVANPTEGTRLSQLQIELDLYISGGGLTRDVLFECIERLRLSTESVKWEGEILFRMLMEKDEIIETSPLLARLCDGVKTMGYTFPFVVAGRCADLRETLNGVFADHGLSKKEKQEALVWHAQLVKRVAEELQHTQRLVANMFVLVETMADTVGKDPPRVMILVGDSKYLGNMKAIWQNIREHDASDSTWSVDDSVEISRLIKERTLALQGVNAIAPEKGAWDRAFRVLKQLSCRT